MQNLIRYLLLHCDPEKAHKLGQHLIRWRYSKLFPKHSFHKPVNLFGLTFSNPVGMAAGWDKDGVCIDALFRMGFGFVEVGTVTPKAQAGNPKPRLFRLQKKKALINRMGFNNAGVEALVEKIKNRQVPGILGVNIGKNRDTSLANALDDYVFCLRAVFAYADYVVVNISSPNTEGLRALQSEQYLQDLLLGLQMTRQELSVRYQKQVPLLVKTSVDFPKEDRPTFVNTLLQNNIDGLIISNTSIDHSAVAGSRYAKEKGGLSGQPLRLPTTQMIQDISVLSRGKLPIIGVGGILTAADALSHLQAGASLVQLFTGFVYRGPELIWEIIEVLES